MFNRDISVKFISTINQVADIFTKALSSARFAHLTSKLMVIPPPISLSGAVRITDMDSIWLKIMPSHFLRITLLLKIQMFL